MQKEFEIEIYRGSTHIAHVKLRIPAYTEKEARIKAGKWASMAYPGKHKTSIHHTGKVFPLRSGGYNIGCWCMGLG